MLSLNALSPMLADSRTIDLSESGWIFEQRLSGCRLLAQTRTPTRSGKVQLQTRDGSDATGWFPEVVESLAQLKEGPCILDGVACVLDDRGRCDREGLSERAKRRGWYRGARPVFYFVFDLLMVQGVDLTSEPLSQRKQRLARLLGTPLLNVIPVHHYERSEAVALLQQGKAQADFAGLMAKRGASIYKPGIRSADWVALNAQGPHERIPT
jgi:bifunctional non-homologous end joining protein LigD